jgi:hypothetical protein
MNSMVRERDTHVSCLFIEVTPGIRRALELLAEASITLLDEIDAPVDGLEEDPDFEITHEDDEANGDHEPNFGWTVDGKVIGADDDREPNLGWTCDGDMTGEDVDEDLAAAETSSGFPARLPQAPEKTLAARAAFDPRLAARPVPEARDWTDLGDGRRIAYGRFRAPSIPRFPHEPDTVLPFVMAREMARLRGELFGKTRKQKKKG